jgi:peroxiredoxin
MKKLLTPFIVAALSVCVFAASAVVRPASDFSWQGLGGRLSRVRGQPVVLVIAKSASSKPFKKQAKLLRELYQQFAARQVIFVAAFQEDGGSRLASDIPWVIADNGAKIAADYGVDGNKFALVVIGKDGNIDMQTAKITPPERVRAVLVSAFPVQAAERK